MNQKKSKRVERNKLYCDECERSLPERATHSFYRMPGFEICGHCVCEGRVKIGNRNYQRDSEGNKTYF